MPCARIEPATTSETATILCLTAVLTCHNNLSDLFISSDIISSNTSLVVHFSITLKHFAPHKNMNIKFNIRNLKIMGCP